MKVDWYVLNKYLPAGALYFVKPYFEKYTICLVITQHRETRLGDYSFNTQHQIHKITINNNLNPYSFLITLIHELAHLITFEQYKNTVSPHGKEWKEIYKAELTQFLTYKLLPQDLEDAVLHSMHNLKASSCSTSALDRALKKYDHVPIGLMYVHQLKPNDVFEYKNERTFKMIAKIKLRYKCIEIKTQRFYLFNSHALVKVL